jgi:hypothetical protein
MRLRVLTACFGLGLTSGSALAVDEPMIWRDPDTGCAYLLSRQGGIAVRHRKDGSIDCPEAGSPSRFVDDTARGIARGLDALQREVGRLRDRFNDQAQPPL